MMGIPDALGRVGSEPEPGPECGVCGSLDVDIDAVEPGDRPAAAARGDELLWLAECRHCDHRWTRWLPAPPWPGSPVVARRAARVEPRETALPEVRGAA